MFDLGEGYLSLGITNYVSYRHLALHLTVGPFVVLMFGMYTMSTFSWMLIAGVVTRLCPSVLTPFFMKLLNAVTPKDDFMERPIHLMKNSRSRERISPPRRQLEAQ